MQQDRTGTGCESEGGRVSQGMPLQRLADSRGIALGALFRTHYTGCCGLRSTAGERK